MKKYSLFFISFVLSCFQIYAQIFGLRQHNPEKYYSSLLPSTSTTFASVYCVNYGVPSNKFQNQILVFDANHHLIDSIAQPKNISCPIQYPLRVNAQVYNTGFEVDSLNSGFDYRLIVTKSDTNNHIQNIKVLSPFLYGFRYSNIVYLNNNYYLSISSNYHNGTFVYKLNNNLQKTDSLFLFNSTNFQINIFNNNLLLNGSSFPNCATNLSGYAQKLMIDTALNIISCKELNSLNTSTLSSCNMTMGIQGGYCKIQPLSNTKYLAIGSDYYNCSANYAIINAILDKNDALVSYKLYGDNRTKNYLDLTNYLAIHNNQILTLGVIGHDFQTLQTQQSKPSKLFINKLDTSGNEIWVKEFGGDMYYRPQSIIFANDGGCLIAGLRYDSIYASSIGLTNIMQSFLLKLDANGNYNALGLTENGKNVSNQIKCFPNPAQQTLFFDVPFEENIEVEIFDLLGRRVLRKENYKNYTAINIEGLVQGAYLYQIKTKTSFYSGKFLKTSD